MAGDQSVVELAEVPVMFKSCSDQQEAISGARLRLTGEPPGVYEQILPQSKSLAERPDADREAPSLEFYRRRDVIDLLQPLL